MHEVHADEASLDAALQRTLAHILSCGPKAIAHTKQLLARARHTSAEYLIDDAAAVFAGPCSATKARKAPAPSCKNVLRLGSPSGLRTGRRSS